MHFLQVQQIFNRPSHCTLYLPLPTTIQGINWGKYAKYTVEMRNYLINNYARLVAWLGLGLVGGRLTDSRAQTDNNNNKKQYNIIIIISQSVRQPEGNEWNLCLHSAKSGVAFYSTNVAFDLNFGHAPEMSNKDYEEEVWGRPSWAGVTTLLTFSRCKETVYCATEECVNVAGGRGSDCDVDVVTRHL